MANISDIRKGMTIKWENEYWNVVEFLHVKPGKGGAFMRLKLKNLKTERALDQTWRSNVEFEEVKLEKKEWTYSYSDTDFVHLMDPENFEIIPFPASYFKNISDLMKENGTVYVFSIDEEPISIELPAFVDLKIVRTEPGEKGNTVQNTNKPAEVETGATIQVPLFVNEGDVIKIDTRNHSYIERVSK
ncbi:MAG: elongation factor P [Candidatus Coatesbacteria bacterium]|nr:elongation factor P [Candidatus Coatesbacteria bacterium]